MPWGMFTVAGQQEKIHCTHTTNQIDAAPLHLYSSRPKFNNLSFNRHAKALRCPEQHPVCISAGTGLGRLSPHRKDACKYTFCVPLSSGLWLWTESVAQTSRGKLGWAQALAGGSYFICAQLGIMLAGDGQNIKAELSIFSHPKTDASYM